MDPKRRNDYIADIRARNSITASKGLQFGCGCFAILLAVYLVFAYSFCWFPFNLTSVCQIPF